MQVFICRKAEHVLEVILRERVSISVGVSWHWCDGGACCPTPESLRQPGWKLTEQGVDQKPTVCLVW